MSQDKIGAVNPTIINGNNFAQRLNKFWSEAIEIVQDDDENWPVEARIVNHIWYILCARGIISSRQKRLHELRKKNPWPRALMESLTQEDRRFIARSCADFKEEFPDNLRFQATCFRAIFGDGVE